MNESNSLRIGPLVGAVSALAALVLAVLYTVGAVLTTGAFRAAHLSVRDTLPVVPTQQYLARGMAVFLSSFGIALLLLIGLSFSVWQAMRFEQRRRWVRDHRREIANVRRKLMEIGETYPKAVVEANPDFQKGLDDLREMEEHLDATEPAPPQGWLKLALWVTCGTVVVFCGYVRLLDLPVFLVLATILGLAAVGILPIVWVPASMTLALYLSALVTAFYYPSLLAHATLTTHGRQSVRGLLITQNADHWFLGVAGGKVVVVPDRVVLSGAVSPSGHAPYPRHVYRGVLSWFG